MPTQGASALAGAQVHLTSHVQPLVKYFQGRSQDLELLLRLVGLFQLKVT